MRGPLSRLVLTAMAAGVLVSTNQGSAVGDTKCQQTNPATGQCLIWVEAPSSPVDPGDSGGDGPADTGSGAACHWDGTDQGISKPPPGPVPCSSEYGYWSNGYHCYIEALDPQPPAGDPSWQGHEPGVGAVYQCYQPQVELLIYVWSQDPPPNSGSGPTPREVAQLAAEQMDIHAINIGIVPEPGEGNVGIVGMPVWMWAANPNSHTVGPASASATAGGITVAATARLHRLTWDMGDGTTVTCNGAGTPYEASYGDKESPDCGHVYERSSSTESDGKFEVTATSDWIITWSGAGQTGVIRLNGLSRSVEISVGEAQVLVQ
jgi:hypothetical protein